MTWPRCCSLPPVACPQTKRLGVKGQIRDKVIEVPMLVAGISPDELQSGQMPEAGQNEVLAGAGLERRDTVNVGVHTLKVVGVLKPGLTFFADSYLIPPGAANDKLFSATVPTVVDAWLVRSSAEEQRDGRVRKRWEAVFPPEKYAWVTAEERLEPRTYQLYLAGLAVFLLGGSGALIGFYRWLSAKITAPILAAPLLEMKARPRLVWGVHLVYFGIVIGGSLLISAMPEAQLVLVAKGREALASKNGILGIAGQAYLSGNIPFAAAVTFAVNYLLGSLAYITLPSILVPGSAILLASIRAVGWGLILAPLPRPLALGMLPHSSHDASGGRRLHPGDNFRPVDPDPCRQTQPGRESVHAIRPRGHTQFQGADLDRPGTGGGGDLRGDGSDLDESRLTRYVPFLRGDRGVLRSASANQSRIESTKPGRTSLASSVSSSCSKTDRSVAV